MIIALVTTCRFGECVDEARIATAVSQTVNETVEICDQVRSSAK